MRSFLVAVATLLVFSISTAQAKVFITVDKDAQVMTVAVDGIARYRWPVSTGIPSRETPSGSFRTFRMEEDHFSKEFDDAPMPHSIFFTKIGHAIHGTDFESRLGTPASHGCVRLSKANAATLYALVEEQGVLNTTVTLTGSAQVALARNPKARLARRDPNQPYAPNDQYQYDNSAGNPVSLAPPQGTTQPLFPQARTDDGYIYPADGSSTGQRYPAPRASSQRAYDGQAYYQQQPAYNQQPQPGYYQQQQQPRYYQQQQPGYQQQPYDNGSGYQYAPQARSYQYQRGLY